MDRDALADAEERLVRAEEALARLRTTTEFATTLRAWSEFITACSTIYNKLLQGAKINKKSDTWFGNVKKLHKEDELLRYIRNARNTDEHGLARIVKKKASRVVYLADPAIHHNPPSLFFSGDEESATDKFSVKMTEQGTGIELPLYVQPPERYTGVSKVYDIHGRSYGAPKIHLGEDIEVDEPLGIATLALSYFRDLVDDARKYVE